MTDMSAYIIFSAGYGLAIPCVGYVEHAFGFPKCGRSKSTHLKDREEEVPDVNDFNIFNITRELQSGYKAESGLLIMVIHSAIDVMSGRNDFIHLSKVGGVKPIITPSRSTVILQAQQNQHRRL